LNRNGCRFPFDRIQLTAVLSFKRSGDLTTGNFDDATILESFGEVPKN
jgi:hypothetical protein